MRCGKALSKAEKPQDHDYHDYETDNVDDLIHGFSSVALSKRYLQSGVGSIAFPDCWILLGTIRD
jgi:hypothetical protein